MTNQVDGTVIVSGVRGDLLQQALGAATDTGSWPSVDGNDLGIDALPGQVGGQHFTYMREILQIPKVGKAKKPGTKNTW